MTEGGLTVLDGTALRSLAFSPIELNGAITGAHLLEIADTKASQSLFGIQLPQNIKNSALARVIGCADESTFRRTELTAEQASKTFSDYLSAIADQLKDEPLLVSILNGSTPKSYLEDEDDFAMLAEDLFTCLDAEDKGKICKSETRNALVSMGVEMGIPPFSEFPLLNDILKKHGAEGEEELGQAQFAELLQPIVQEIANVLSEKHVVVIHDVKVVNGSKLRKILADEKQLKSVIERIFHEKDSGNNKLGKTQSIRNFLEKNAKELGLPPADSNEAAAIVYDAVFSDVEIENSSVEEDKFTELVKDILLKFAEQLEANPIYFDLDN
ncbi:hypothetical protein SLE2022_084860 [Rubroshorea leprosula]